ncbi:hypothetical protein H9L39_08764 [Fusarium oxysporum f. sp. albedinis]|nr:hypothetical protein H9L39_08764 [Fusarium oxysporum f. sp. albedinis]
MVPNFPPKARALQSGSLRNLQASQPSPFVWEYPHPALLAYDPFPLTSAAEPTASLLTCTTSGPWQLVRQNPSANKQNGLHYSKRSMCLCYFPSLSPISGKITIGDIQMVALRPI